MQMTSRELGLRLGFSFLCVVVLVLGFLLFWVPQERYDSGFQDGFWVCVSEMGEVAQLEEH